MKQDCLWAGQVLKQGNEHMGFGLLYYFVYFYVYGTSHNRKWTLKWHPSHLKPWRSSSSNGSVPNVPEPKYKYLLTISLTPWTQQVPRGTFHSSSALFLFPKPAPASYLCVTHPSLTHTHRSHPGSAQRQPLFSHELPFHSLFASLLPCAIPQQSISNRCKDHQANKTHLCLATGFQWLLASSGTKAHLLAKLHLSISLCL